MSEKIYVVTWDMFQMHARRLSERLLPASQWKGIIAVSRGGLFPAAVMARGGSSSYWNPFVSQVITIITTRRSYKFFSTPKCQMVADLSW